VLSRFDPGARSLVPLDGGAPEWVHASEPSPDELARLERDFGVPPDFLRHALDDDELARVDRVGDGPWRIVLRVPWAPGGPRDVPFRAAPLALVLWPDRIVTIARRPTGVAREVAADGGAPGDPRRLVLELLRVGADRFLTHLGEMEATIDRVEDELRSSQRNREVEELVRFQKSLVHFKKALTSNELMLERLQSEKGLGLSHQDRERAKDVAVELRQAIAMTSIAEEILSQTMDAFATLVSNNLNVAMRILTAVTIVLAVPALVASVYGMNVDLPLQRHPQAFLVVVALSAALGAGVAAWFWRKRYFS
jgi:magnesium transporter